MSILDMYSIKDIRERLEEGCGLTRNSVFQHAEQRLRQAEAFSTCMTLMDALDVPRYDSEGESYSLWYRVNWMVEHQTIPARNPTK